MSDHTPDNSAPQSSDNQETGNVPSAGQGCSLAYKSLWAWLVFLLVTIVILAGDLLIKHYSFEYVGKYPVAIVEAPEGATPDGRYDLTPDGKRVEVLVYGKVTDPIPQDEKGITLIPKILSLKITLNPGAVFGLGKGGRSVFIAISFVAITVIGYFFVRSKSKATLVHVALACILAGALGNLYDRALYGAVRDMFHLFPTTNLWPWIFNLADVSLIVGVGLVIVHSWLYSDEQPRQPKK